MLLDFSVINNAKLYDINHIYKHTLKSCKYELVLFLYVYFQPCLHAKEEETQVKVCQDYLFPYRCKVVRMMCVSWQRSFLRWRFWYWKSSSKLVSTNQLSTPHTFLRINIIHSYKHDVSQNVRLGIERSEIRSIFRQPMNEF